MITTSGTDQRAQEKSLFPTEKSAKSMEKSENFPAWNTAFMKSPEFPGADRFIAVLSDLGCIYVVPKLKLRWRSLLIQNMILV
jgi:hypothetical protein